MDETLEKNTCFSIADFLTFKDVPTLVPELTNKEKREILMLEIYNYYKAETDKRKKENWKRYIKYLKANHIQHTPKTAIAFKRNKLYIKEVSLESMKYLLKHIKTDDLHYFTSTGKEFAHTGRSFGGWL